MSVDLIPGEFSAFTVAIAVLSGFIVFFGFVSMFLKERCFLSEAFVAVIVGIIAGPLVSNAINPYNWKDNDEITKQLSRCIIAIQVMAVGIELPKHYLKKEWLTMLMLLLPVMIFMWLVSGLFIWWMVPPINYLESLVIAACVCPTDPILANSVVKGRFAEKHVPAHIRNALSAESGANDGMGFPFLFLAIFLIGEDNVGVAIGKWIYETCLFQIALSCVIGIVVGWIARKILQWSERNHLIDKPSFLSFAIALALFLMSMTGFSGSDDVLACFAAGNAFSWDDWFRSQTEEAHFQDVIDMMLNLSIFVYIGAIIPWHDFGDASLGLATWRLVVIAIMILLFRRLPIVLLLKPVMPAMMTYREAAFSGWFGPMGVGAVFLSKIAKEQMEKIYQGQPEMPVSVKVINPVVLFIVLSSVLVHGTTIPLFKLGKRIRTRTLSMTSITSSQVLRLPKLQFGQHASRRSEEDLRYRPSKDMTQLQRNTLFNTIQHDLQQKEHDSGTTLVIDHHADLAVDIHDEPSDAEEDFLPDDLSRNGGSHSRVSSPQVFSSSFRQEDMRHGSATTLENQAIRFIEPVKPRSYSEKQDVSDTNTKTRQSRHQKESPAMKGKPLDDVNGKRYNSASSNTSNDSGGSTQNQQQHLSVPTPAQGKSLRHLFRKQPKEPAAAHISDITSKPVPALEATDDKTTTMETYIQDKATTSEQEISVPLHPRVEVWEESHHVIVEDKQDPSTQVIIDKSDVDWRVKAKETISALEAKLNDLS